MTTSSLNRQADKQAGFTLVEVLISLFIFALISAGTMGAMFQTFAAKDRLDAAATELADIAAFRSILRADLSALDLRPARDGLGGRELTLLTTDGEALLTFTRLGRSNPTAALRGQTERVRYLLRDGKFIRESLPHENPADLESWRGRVLIEGVQRAEIAFVTRGSSSDIRIENWSIIDDTKADNIELRGAVELTLTDERGNETAHLFEIRA